jgi:hypothetical protein
MKLRVQRIFEDMDIKENIFQNIEFYKISLRKKLLDYKRKSYDKTAQIKDLIEGLRKKDYEIMLEFYHLTSKTMDDRNEKNGV